MARQPLPDPQWQEAPGSCLQCGYSLEGLAPPGPCPECGASFEARSLVLYGVVQGRGRASPLRKAGFWIIGILFILVSQTFPIILFKGGGLYLLIVTVVLVGALVWLIVTGPRERRGAERIIFTPSGVARLPLAGHDMRDRIFIPWPEGSALTTKRVSPFWRRVRITQRARIVLDAGVRCPDERAAEVEAAIRDLLTPSDAPRTPPTSPTF